MQNVEHDPEFYIKEAYRIRGQFFADAFMLLANAIKKTFRKKSTPEEKENIVELKKTADTAQKAA